MNEKASSSASVTSSSESKQLKSLSRNALYTPLVAYEQTRIDPNLYMGAQNNIPTTLKETTFTSFFQKVGEDYHRNRARGPDPRNNGSRPLSVADMEERLRQKVVTLIGGGINATITSSSSAHSKKSGDAKVTKGQKRPRREWSQVKEKLSQSQSSSTDTVSFLRVLNSHWNAYVSRILNLDPNVDQDTDISSTIRARMVEVRPTIELLGAHVQVVACPAKQNLVGVLGVLIGETTNTWSIVIPKDSGRKKKRKQSHSSIVVDSPQQTPPTTEDTCSDRGEVYTRVVIVPKRASALDLIIPLPTSAKQSEDGINRHESIIQQAPRSIFITITGNKA